MQKATPQPSALFKAIEERRPDLVHVLRLPMNRCMMELCDRLGVKYTCDGSHESFDELCHELTEIISEAQPKTA